MDTRKREEVRRYHGSKRRDQNKNDDNNNAVRVGGRHPDSSSYRLSRRDLECRRSDRDRESRFQNTREGSRRSLTSQSRYISYKSRSNNTYFYRHYAKSPRSRSPLEPPTFRSTRKSRDDYRSRSRGYRTVDYSMSSREDQRTGSSRSSRSSKSSREIRTSRSLGKATRSRNYREDPPKSSREARKYYLKETRSQSIRDRRRNYRSRSRDEYSHNSRYRRDKIYKYSNSRSRDHDIDQVRYHRYCTSSDRPDYELHGRPSRKRTEVANNWRTEKHRGETSDSKGWDAPPPGKWTEVANEDDECLPNWREDEDKTTTTDKVCDDEWEYDEEDYYEHDDNFENNDEYEQDEDFEGASDDENNHINVWGLRGGSVTGVASKKILAHLRNVIQTLWDRNPVRIAGLAVFRLREGASLDTAEWLLLQTSFISHTWNPPKGHADWGGEDDITTALRETQVGVKNSCQCILTVVVHSRRRRPGSRPSS